MAGRRTGLDAQAGCRVIWWDQNSNGRGVEEGIGWWNAVKCRVFLVLFSHTADARALRLWLEICFCIGFMGFVLSKHLEERKWENVCSFAEPGVINGYVDVVCMLSQTSHWPRINMNICMAALNICMTESIGPMQWSDKLLELTNTTCNMTQGCV